ncbi:MAG: maleylpyruvate isomerase family mycothiol-dependent enzyme [Mycobacteriales bacterium]
MTEQANAPTERAHATTARRPALDRHVAMRLAATEYERVSVQLASLSPEDWTRPSGCPPWDVRALATHALGMAQMAASLREQLRQMRKAKRAGGIFIDALTGLQVDEHRDLSPQQVRDRLRQVGPRAAKARRRTPGLVRRRTMPDEQPLGGRPDSGTERWTFGYLVDVILTRDPWMHRTDIAAATGRPLELTAEHDGVLVADVVQEWAARHGSPCRLILTGPAGGSWTFGAGGPEMGLDAVEFCRILAGRGSGEGLLATEVPF